MRKIVSNGLLGMSAQLPTIVLNALSKPESWMSLSSWVLGFTIGIYTLISARRRNLAHAARDREQAELFRAELASKTAQEKAWLRWGINPNAMTNVSPTVAPVASQVLPPLPPTV